jgi:hypothetical protein
MCPQRSDLTVDLLLSLLVISSMFKGIKNVFRSNHEHNYAWKASYGSDANPPSRHPGALHFRENAIIFVFKFCK